MRYTGDSDRRQNGIVTSSSMPPAAAGAQQASCYPPQQQFGGSRYPSYDASANFRFRANSSATGANFETQPGDDDRINGTYSRINNGKLINFLQSRLFDGVDECKTVIYVIFFM
jgi:hypothetical protein